MAMPALNSMEYGQLEAAFCNAGYPKYRARQVFKWLQKEGSVSFEAMTDLPKSMRRELEEQYEIAGCSILETYVSQLDGTRKYLLELSDGKRIEAVLMQYRHGNSLCISSQAGCRMGCGFCASALTGLERNLTAGEMLAQIHAVQRESGLRVSHIVMMGVGEPLDNFEEVLRFLALVHDNQGLHISLRNVSVSTCGLVPQIYALAKKSLGITLSISLHAPNDEIRRSIMPVGRKWDIEELLNACKAYTQATGRRISFEYIMLRGVNDSLGCAAELAGRLNGMLCHVNLIPANHVEERSYRKSEAKIIEKFANQLKCRGINATIRRTLGSDINASCGQLRLQSRM